MSLTSTHQHMATEVHATNCCLIVNWWPSYSCGPMVSSSWFHHWRLFLETLVSNFSINHYIPRVIPRLIYEHSWVIAQVFISGQCFLFLRSAFFLNSRVRTENTICRFLRASKKRSRLHWIYLPKQSLEKIFRVSRKYNNNGTHVTDYSHFLQQEGDTNAGEKTAKA